MRTVNVKKLYRGNIDLRSYIVDKAIEDKESIEVILEGHSGKMVLSPENLEDDWVRETEIKSKSNRDSYTLLSYKWKPI